jgi:DNA polymerase-4
MRPQNRKIIHIDMDVFYASVEQLDNPESNNRQTVGGSRIVVCVAAASAACESLVRSAYGSRQRHCPLVIFVPRLYICANFA